MRLPSLLAHSLIRFRLTEISAALFCQHNVAFAYAELMHARTSTDAFYCAFRRAFSRAFSASPARLARAAGGNAQHVARPRTTGRLLHVLLVALFLAPVWATAVHAAPPMLYHSANDDGVAATGIPQELGLPMVTLFLYLDAGAASTATGTTCVDGDGDELCGWEWALLVNGGADIQGFVPDPAQDIVSRTSATELAGIGGNAVAGQLGPIRLGEVDLNITAPAWSVSMQTGTAVTAAFTLTNIPSTEIAVPEPGFAAALGSGCMILGLLARPRRRSASRTFLLVILLLLLAPGAAVAQDADADGVLDGVDNCVHSANPLQEDFAGLYGPPGDGIGDACQCGDVNSDGAVDLLDAATYERGLAGLLPIDLDEGKCSVIGNRLDCDPNDRQTLRETIVGSGAGIQPVCQAANAVPPGPSRIVAAGDSITQGFSADCTCNAGFFGLICLLCPAGGDQPQHSWFDGSSLGNSFYDLYGGPGSGITSSRVSVSGAEMSSGGDRFSIQVDDILALSPVPDLVVVELGGNDVCNRGCVDAASCGNPLYDDATWTTAIETGLDKLVGFGHPTSIPISGTVYLLGVPRVQDLYAAGVAKQTGNGSVNCDSFRDSFDVCEIATLNAPMSGEDLPTRLAALETRIPRYNEIIRDLALAYTTNSNGRNPNGIEVVTDYVNESIASVGTTPFGENEINGGDCFHPSVGGQSTLAAGAWLSNPR